MKFEKGDIVKSIFHAGDFVIMATKEYPYIPQPEGVLAWRGKMEVPSGEDYMMIETEIEGFVAFKYSKEEHLTLVKKVGT